MTQPTPTRPTAIDVAAYLDAEAEALDLELIGLRLELAQLERQAAPVRVMIASAEGRRDTLAAAARVLRPAP